jgi:hypothetical protein
MTALCLKMERLKHNKTTILPVVMYGCETWSHAKGRILTEGV